jgi:hypothetical protein
MIVIVLLIGYAIFNSRFLLKGPEIAIAGLEENIDAIESPTRDFSLQGTVLHSSFISLNNRPIFIDKTGHFSEKLLLSDGVSIVELYARDKFGKEIRKKINVVYTGEHTTTPADQIALRVLSASSTPDSKETEQILIEENLSNTDIDSQNESDVHTTQDTSTSTQED